MTGCFYCNYQPSGCIYCLNVPPQAPTTDLGGISLLLRDLIKRVAKLEAQLKALQPPD